MAENSKLGRSLIKSSLTKPLNDTKYVHQAAQPLSDTKYVQQAAQPLNDSKYVHQAAHIRPSGHTWSRIRPSRLASTKGMPSQTGKVQSHHRRTAFHKEGETTRGSHCQGQQERGPSTKRGSQRQRRLEKGPSTKTEASTSSFRRLPEGESIVRRCDHYKNLMPLQEENRLQEVNIYFTIIIFHFAKILPPYQILSWGTCAVTDSSTLQVLTLILLLLAL